MRPPLNNEECKIAVISCYLGKLPEYFNIFINSCQNNPNIHFHLFLSEKYQSESKNIFIHTIDKYSLESLIQIKIGITPNLEKPYKLCDFKPAFGLIFQDYIKEYNYWGFCDIDVVLGKIGWHIAPFLKNNYDIVSFRKEYITGFFAIFKNSHFVNTLFTYSKDVRKVFTDERNYCFDECNYQFTELCRGKNILELDSDIESFTEVVVKMMIKGKLNVGFQTLAKEHVVEGLIKWDNGKIVDNQNNEHALFHLINIKDKKFNFFTKKMKPIYLISKYGVFINKFSYIIFLMTIPVLKWLRLLLHTAKYHYYLLKGNRFDDIYFHSVYIQENNFPVILDKINNRRITFQSQLLKELKYFIFCRGNTFLNDKGSLLTIYLDENSFVKKLILSHSKRKMYIYAYKK